MERDLIEWRISQALATSPILQEAVIAESGLMEILTQAACEHDQVRRWQRYEDLKAACQGYVGLYAKQEGLRKTTMYEAVIEALDGLLPEPLEDTA